MAAFLHANLAYATRQCATSGIDINIQPHEAGWCATVGGFVTERGDTRTAWAVHQDAPEALRLALVELTL